jgi:hypothetical protein
MVDRFVRFKPSDALVKVDKDDRPIDPELVATNVLSKTHWKEAELAISEFLVGLHIDRESLKASGVRAFGPSHALTVISALSQKDLLRWRREFQNHKSDDVIDPWPNTRTPERVRVCVCVCMCVFGTCINGFRLCWTAYGRWKRQRRNF